MLVHRVLLPRGRKFVPVPALESAYEKVFITTGNKSICVLVREAVSQARGTVILAHPYLAEARNFFIGRGHADLYYDAGFHVVTFDFNGFGESPFIDFNYENDLSAVAEYAHRRFTGLGIYGHGVSFGAAQIIVYATHTDHRFKALIIENCLDSNLSYYKKRNIRLHLLVSVLMKLFPAANRNHDYVRAVSQLRNLSRVLFIYNNDDDLTTETMGRKLMLSCRLPASFILMKGKHLNALKDNPAEYALTVRSFLG